MKKKSLFVTILLLLIAVFAFSLTACNNGVGTLESLKNEYGIVVDGGNFEEGSTLVGNEIAATTEEAAEVLAAIAEQNYNKDGSVYIFDIYVTKDGKEVQPDGKVKVSVPLPNAEVDNYLVFHVKADNSVESLVPTVADGKISFEVSSFSYFVIAEAANPDAPPHVHNFEWVEGKESTCKEEGIAPHYHCDGCGKNFDPNYGEMETVSIPKAEHEYGSMYWGKSANFFEDGNIEYYQCSECEKYFDNEYNEVETPVIPKYSTNISICVNGVPTALVLGEQHENFIEWSLEGLSVTKGDVITICQTDNVEFSHNYFAEGNVGIDGKIITTAAAANVLLTATPNGLMLFIDGYQYEGIVIEINGVQYPMIYTSYPDKTTTYIYGYVNFAVGDKFVIVDNVSGTVYDYDDLDEGYLWDTWDFHRGDNGEFVIDYACRYGIEFDYGGDKKIYINKTFASLDGSSYELNFENTDIETVSLEQMQFETGSEAYEDLMWYYNHKDVVNKEDIVSYIGEKGLYVYIVKLQLEEGTKFNIKNLTVNSTINAEHLVEVYTENGSLTKDGDYVKVLKNGYYSIVYMPCFNSFMVEEVETTADVLMMLGGEFIYLDKDSDGMIYHENFAAEFNTSITFMRGDGLSYYPIILDREMDSSLLRTYEANGISVVYFTKAGTYNLAYNVETGVLSITSVGGDNEQGGDDEQGGNESEETVLPKDIYISTMKKYAFIENPDNSDELCYLGLVLESYDDFRIRDTDNNYISDITLASGTTGVYTNGSSVMVVADGTYNIYINKTTHEVRIVVVS